MRPAPAHVERFRADLEALTGRSPERFGVAVSGGPDSLALLLLAAAAFPSAVRAATVNHGIRPEAETEAAAVARICAQLEVPHAILAASVGREASLQQAARRARYAALGEWAGGEDLPWIATGHQLDDQAETLLMRLLRGSGVAGLAGVRRKGPLPAPGARPLLVRPLLGWRRAELAAIVEAAGIEAAADPTNIDERHDRARIRRLLGETGWVDPVPVARSAAALSDAEAALAWAARQLRAERVRAEGRELVFDPSELPREIVRRILLSILAEIVPNAGAPRGEALDRFQAALETGGTATLGGVKGSGGGTWRFGEAPPRR